MIVTVYGILLVVLSASNYKKNRNGANKKRGNNNDDLQSPPEPPGRWPLIGHLPLLINGASDVPTARTLGALADTHGPVFALHLGGNTRALVVSSEEAIRGCFTDNNDANFATRPNLAIGKRVGYNNTMFSHAPHGPFWRDTRKMATTELFSSASLDALRGVKAAVANSYLRELHAGCMRGGGEAAVEMDGWFERLMISMNIRVVAGRWLPPEAFSGGEAEKLRRVVKEVLYLSGVFVASDAVPWLEWVDFGGFLGRMDRAFEEFDSLLQKYLEDNKAEGEQQIIRGGETDFIRVMLSSLAGNDAHRDTIIKATTMTLILTGTESISLTLIWALSHLLNHPRELRKAQDEIDKAIGHNRWVEESDMKNLPYLQAIIKESLRLNPPGPLSGPREAMQDCYVAGYRVPKGTRLIVNLWKLHRDPRVWDNPDEFRPERFLSEHASISFRGQCFEYAPFSAGRRACPAVTYAVQVTHLVLARLLQGFDVAALGGGPVDMREGLGIALPKVTPLEAVLSPRLSPELYELL